MSHSNQEMAINGLATPNKEDSIVAQLKDVDVEYILNLVNFHSVDFAGKASGKAIVKSIFNDPDAYAQLDVKDFEFEHGPLGVLHANVNFNKEQSQIDIKAVADDGPEHQTLIDGYVSPEAQLHRPGYRGARHQHEIHGELLRQFHGQHTGKGARKGEPSGRPERHQPGGRPRRQPARCT